MWKETVVWTPIFAFHIQLSRTKFAPKWNGGGGGGAETNLNQINRVFHQELEASMQPNHFIMEGDESSTELATNSTEKLVI